MMISWLFFGKERTFTNCNLIILKKKNLNRNGSGEM